MLLGAVAVHVDRLEDPPRQILLHGRRQLGHQEVEEDRELLPGRVGIGQHLAQEGVRAHEGLGLALELDLPVLVERAPVVGDAGIEDRVERVAPRAPQIALDQQLDLRL